MWQIHPYPHTKSIVSSGRRDLASVCFGGKISTSRLQIIVLRKPFMFTSQFFLAGRKPSKNHCASGCQFRSVPVYPWLRKSQRPPSLLLHSNGSLGLMYFCSVGAWAGGLSLGPAQAALCPTLPPSPPGHSPHFPQQGVEGPPWWSEKGGKKRTNE